MPADQYQLKTQKPRRPRRSAGMMIVGLVLFGVGYIPPAIIGGTIAGLDEDTCDCRDAYRMFIPVVGPLTLLHEPGEYNALNALLITDALMQSAGVVLTIFGIMKLSNRDEPELTDERGLRFVTLPTPGGFQGALQLRM